MARERIGRTVKGRRKIRQGMFLRAPYSPTLSSWPSLTIHSIMGHSWSATSVREILPYLYWVIGPKTTTQLEILLASSYTSRFQRGSPTNLILIFIRVINPILIKYRILYCGI